MTSIITQVCSLLRYIYALQYGSLDLLEIFFLIQILTIPKEKEAHELLSVWPQQLGHIFDHIVKRSNVILVSLYEQTYFSRP